MRPRKGPERRAVSRMGWDTVRLSLVNDTCSYHAIAPTVFFPPRLFSF
jgi:hypothetical protein